MKDHRDRKIDIHIFFREKRSESAILGMDRITERTVTLGTLSRLYFHHSFSSPPKIRFPLPTEIAQRSNYLFFDDFLTIFFSLRF